MRVLTENFQQNKILKKDMHLRIFAGCAAFIFLLLYMAPSAQTEHQFSLSERRWAQKWINRDLATLMANATIKKIEAGDQGFKVFVGEPWYNLTFEKKTEYLENLSRAREIAGHSPFFDVFDADKKEITARVTGHGVEIFIPGEGFVQSMPDIQDNSTKILENIQ